MTRQREIKTTSSVLSVLLLIYGVTFIIHSKLAWEPSFAWKLIFPLSLDLHFTNNPLWFYRVPQSKFQLLVMIGRSNEQTVIGRLRRPTGMFLAWF